jgi:hypothetical protein
MFQRQGFFTSGFDKIAPFTDYIGARPYPLVSEFPSDHVHLAAHA